MPDLVQTANALKSLPDQALQLELANPSGAVPSYLVLAEAQRRATLRSGGAQQKNQQASSVYDDVLRNLTSGAPAAGPPAPPGAASPPSGPPPSGLGAVAPGSPPPPGNFKPPQAMAEGGSVDDESYDDGDGEPLLPGAKPGPYQTLLAPKEESAFQAWVQNNKIPFDPRDNSGTNDYDMRGFYQDKAAMKERDARIAKGGSKHFPDTYKTPYHQTFSNESTYATPDAPHWEGDRLIDKSGRVIADETPVKKAEGGSVDDPENEGGADYGSDDGEDSYTPPAQGSADRSADPSQYDNYIQASGERHNVDPDLIRAVIKNESNFKRNAVSGKGATGLMQLTSGTARDMGVKDRKNPEQNIEGGARYLEWLSNHLQTDDPSVILAGYNAGPGAVQKYGGVPPYKETENYINKVQGTLYNLKSQAAQPTDQSPDPSTASATPSAPEDIGGAPPETASTPDLSTVAAPGVAALTAGAMPAGPSAPAAATPAPAEVDASPYSDANIERQRKMFERLYGSKAEPSAALKAEIARLQAQTQYSAKPHFWQMLADFGWGMAASPAHSLFTQIGAGGQAMSQAQAARVEQARKSQLDLLGVDVKLDDQARTAQEKIASLTGQAVNQAAQKQITDFENLRTSTGAVRGNANESPGSGYRFMPNPTGGQGIWLPPTTGTVTDEMLPLLKGMRNSSGNEFQSGDTISATQLGKIQDKLADINVKKIEEANKVSKPSAQEAGLEDYGAMIAQRDNTTIDATKPIMPQLSAAQRVDARKMMAGKTPSNAATISYLADQVARDPANSALVPAIDKPLVDAELAKRNVNLTRQDAATRALAVPQDPAEVSHWATQVQNDAKNWSLVQANKGLAEAVRKELAGRGVNVTQLDATTRSTAEFAHTVRPHIDKISDLIDKIPESKLGPLFGRWNEFRAGTWGAGDPDYIKLRNNINLLDSAVARIHGGARGGGSLPMIDYMHSMLSAGPKDAASMKAGLSVFNEWVKGYESMAPGIAGTTQPTNQAGQTPVRPAAIPWDADAQYNPTRKQWRYRPKGSTEWQTTPANQ